MPTKSSSSVKVFYRSYARDHIVEHLRTKLDNLGASLPIREVVLFGSCAHNRHTVASDIDVLFVYSGPTLPSAYRSVREAVSLPKLEPHCYSESEATDHRDVIDRMIQDGIRIL